MHLIIIGVVLVVVLVIGLATWMLLKDEHRYRKERDARAALYWERRQENDPSSATAAEKRST